MKRKDNIMAPDPNQNPKPNSNSYTRTTKAKKGTIEGFMEINVINETTGKPMHFDINLAKVGLPHLDKNLIIEPNYYRVVFTNKAINGDKSIGGMNYFAAKAYNYKFPYPVNMVQIAQQTTFHKGDGYKNRREKLRGTIAHEVIEAELMRTDRNLPYNIAHMYAMEYEKGIHHHSDKIRVKDRSSKESSIHPVFRMYENKAVIENTDTLRNVTLYAGVVKNSRGWVLSTSYMDDPEDLDGWWYGK
ncbi:MAG: hypothetical protein NTY03_15640 [Candidatus Bathyarchaeota archaeon]|nr:hypothetical protein [Candidatus Bathyarchaeota archaeon]